MTAPFPLLSSDGMRAVDAATMGDWGIPGRVLMESAGRAAADVITSRYSPDGLRVVVLAGTGNNGGDALVTARMLWSRGADVRVVALPTDTDTGDRADNLALLNRLAVSSDRLTFVDRLTDADLVVDGLLGIGATGDLREPILSLCGWANRQSEPIVALDVPSGLNATTGDAPDDSLEVVATGHQWWFEFEYPGLGVTTANELHIPVGQSVNVELRSTDVIHSFWVPRLSGKVDMVPGHDNRLWFTPEEPGVFLGQCAEFCGTSHANMRFRVFVDTQEDFDAWVAQQAADALPPEGELATAGQTIATTICAACHTIRGTNAAGQIGPDLTHVGSRTTIASGILENTPENLRAWITNPPAEKPGSLMPVLPLTDEQIVQVSEYLLGLD